MLKQIAQELATSISNAIECEVAIFDKESIIVGASDSRRLGDFNEGSVEVIRTGKPLLHRPGYIEHMQNTKPGHCFPLLLSGDVIGAVGIAGIKDEVKKYAQLVQSLAEIVMREAMNQMNRISANYAYQELIKSIVNLEPTLQNQEMLLRLGFELGIDLRYAHIPVAVDLLNGDLIGDLLTSSAESQENLIDMRKAKLLRLVDQIFGDVNDISAYIAHDKILILHAFGSNENSTSIVEKVKERCESLRLLFEKEGVKILCGIGIISKKISQLRSSCKSVWLVLSAAKRLNRTELGGDGSRSCFCVQDYFIETVMVDSRDSCMDWYEEAHLQLFLSQPDVNELIKTIRFWCESGFKYTRAAELLFIHRNTLIYRLKKIESLCQISTEAPREVISLYLAILRKWLSC